MLENKTQNDFVPLDILSTYKLFTLYNFSSWIITSLQTNKALNARYDNGTALINVWQPFRPKAGATTSNQTQINVYAKQSTNNNIYRYIDFIILISSLNSNDAYDAERRISFISELLVVPTLYSESFADKLTEYTTATDNKDIINYLLDFKVTDTTYNNVDIAGRNAMYQAVVNLRVTIDLNRYQQFLEISQFNVDDPFNSGAGTASEIVVDVNYI